MKSLMQAIVVAGVFAIPVASFAQSNGPLTRAQVRAESVELEQTGWRPGQGRTTYPAEIQAAEAKVAEKHRSERIGGGDVSGSSESGPSAVSKSN
ncbi:DUF4148 domain-containing protein [Paraburkholderia phenazinium]|uniref:DUF4148 domain-containing protein n=1 Tax=Paraburkholderia phenazinium TaxID=60549 RepID=A0A1N6JDQ8_9BURK|nr:DUF4148 domain-containing protein [Paraburkholderia phenazinium]SIO42279.1 protein of unknown function [Paraburkholderia phenazinium]